MIYKKLITIFLKLLDSSLMIDYKKINRQAFEDWAFRSGDDVGWKSYIAYEDLKLLKELGTPKPDFQYWMLIGKRLQLLSLADEMRKAFELKKSAEEKRKSEIEKENAKS